MQISLEELRKLVFEAVRSRLNEGALQEGPREIGIRSVMMDLREPIVGSLTEDIVRETGIEEPLVERALSTAYERMIMEVVKTLDSQPVISTTGPRRRIVAAGG